jgi:hypothetical protein
LRTSFDLGFWINRAKIFDLKPKNRLSPSQKERLMSLRLKKEGLISLGAEIYNRQAAFRK